MKFCLKFLSVAAALSLAGCDGKDPVIEPDPTPSPQPQSEPEQVKEFAEEGITITSNEFPARWELFSPTASANVPAATLALWKEHGIVRADMSGTDSYITAKSCDSTRTLIFDKLPSSEAIGVANLASGDWFQFGVPVKSLSAGTAVDLMFTMDVTDNNAPKYWILEIFDGGGWKAVEKDLKTAAEDPSVRYSFYIKHESSYQHSTVVQSFKLSNAVRDRFLRLRCRAVGDINSAGSKLVPGASSFVYFVPFQFKSCTIQAYEGIPEKDSRKAAVLGNSFTHYFGTAFILKELARSQGHDIRMRVHVKGSQTFADHEKLDKSLAVINEGGYDFALLQDQSTKHSDYSTTGSETIRTDTENLIAKFRAKSPDITINLENTWAFPSSSWSSYGSMDKFSKALRDGTHRLAAEVAAQMSPIGVAFQKAYNEGFTDLYHTDSKHPNRNGAYLKSCVNYLVLYGEKFDEKASDCGVDHATAVRLRGIAESVVLGHEDEYFIGFDPKAPYFSLTGSAELTVEAEGGTAYTTFIARNTSVSASSESDWARPSASGGKLSISVDAWNSEQDRETVITIKPAGLQEVTVKLKQYGKSVGEKGISTADDLLAFAKAVNEGGSTAKFTSEKGEVILLADIDMKGRTWTPIGMPAEAVSLANSTTASPGGNAFSGVFNGCGHSIKNLTMSIDIQTTQFAGLFAALRNATVKNLKLENASVVTSGSGIKSEGVAVGTVAGYVYGSVIDNVGVDCSFTGNAKSTASRHVSYGGIAGMLYSPSSTDLCKIVNCTAKGEISVKISEKYSNTNTVCIGGIAGSSSSSGSVGQITSCTNNAKIAVGSHRAAGIVCNAFKLVISDCVNNGNVTCNWGPDVPSSVSISGVRMGGIAAYNSNTSNSNCLMTGCTNNGIISTTQPGSAAGGVFGLLKYYKMVNCKNTGNVICPEGMRGLLVGIAQKASSGADEAIFDNCSLRGAIGADPDGADAVAATAENYLQLGLSFASGVSSKYWSSSYIHFLAQ